MSFLLVVGIGVFIIIVFVEKYKKGERGLNVLNYLICLAISGIFFAMAIPDNRHVRRPYPALKLCHTAQRILLGAIEMYNEENKNNLFPSNCNKDELEKYEKDLLVKENYLKSIVEPSRDCSFEIKDSYLYCLEHGSMDSRSPFYTDGKPVKETEIHEPKLEKKSDKEIEQRDCLISGILVLIASLRILYFISLG